MFCWCATYALIFLKIIPIKYPFRICTTGSATYQFMICVMDIIFLDTEERMHGNIARFGKVSVDKAWNTPAEER